MKLPAERFETEISEMPIADLRGELSRTAARMFLADQLIRSMSIEENSIAGRQVLSKPELTQLRRQMGNLQRDLRAELRRRGAL